MPARDVYHAPIRRALEKDGWQITHDPYRIKLSRGRNLYVDLGAERLIAAQRDSQTIAVEVKSFRSASEMKDLEEALGQFTLYRQLLRRYDPSRTIYLAIPEAVRRSVFEEEAGQILIEDGLIKIISVDVDREELVAWIPEL